MELQRVLLMGSSEQPGTSSEVPQRSGKDAPRALISVYDKTGVVESTPVAIRIEEV